MNKKPAKRPPKPPQPRSRPGKPETDVKENTYDKTIADSFPASDPPSSIPNPEDADDAA